MTTIQRCKPLLGTFVEISLTEQISNKALTSLSQSMFEKIKSVQNRMSFHDKSSELSYINQFAHQKVIEMSDEMTTVIKHALWLSNATKGDFDTSIAGQLVAEGILPDHHYHVNATANWKDIILEHNKIHFQRPLILDLGGIAKGFAVDAAISIADLDCDTTVNAGGDLRMTHWEKKHVAIRIPYSIAGESVEVEMRAPALATSGHYYNQDIIPTNYNSKEINPDESVSIFSSSCMVADSLTKVAMVHQNSTEIIASFSSHIVKLDRTGHFR
jgi:thiamine biosynthesis lipoprotein